jgi:hypothetical protein
VSYQAVQIGLFLATLFTQLYLLAQVFSAINQEKFKRLRLLGPFALLVPGVLSSRGRWLLAGFTLATAFMVWLSLDLFEMGPLA